jgi:hypothetical protein
MCRPAGNPVAENMSKYITTIPLASAKKVDDDGDFVASTLHLPNDISRRPDYFLQKCDAHIRPLLASFLLGAGQFPV